MLLRLLGLCLLVAGAVPAHAQSENLLSNPGFEDLNNNGLPSGWFTNAAAESGYEAVVDTAIKTEGQNSIRIVSGPDLSAPFAMVGQSIDATPFRGHRLQLTASVRSGAVVSPHLGLWFRVDRADGSIGFFDNMGDRPITGQDWQRYTIEGVVDGDATRITVGVLLQGQGEGWIDNVSLVDLGAVDPAILAAQRALEPRLVPMEGDAAAAPLSERGLENLAAFARLQGLVRWFHPSDEAFAADWNSFLIAAIPQVEAADSPEALAQALRDVFGELAPTLQIVSGTVNDLGEPGANPSGTILRWQHRGLGGSGPVYRSERILRRPEESPGVIEEALPGGIAIRMPMFVAADSGSSTTQESNVARVFGDKPDGWTPSGHDRTTRLAAAMVGWSTLQHFYPYWDVVEVDWNLELRRALAGAASASDDHQFLRVLRELVAAIDDGHGLVRYPSDENAALPLDWRVLNGQLVVTAIGEGVEGIAPGAVVTMIDGIPAEDALALEFAATSGSDPFRWLYAARSLLAGEMDEATTLTLDDGREVAVPMGRERVFAATQRPEPFTEIEPGYFYLDLGRIDQAGLDAAIPQMMEAEGIVFDLRGYPRTDIGWMSHLDDTPFRSAMFLRPEFTGPDGAAQYPVDGGWTIEPADDILPENRVFLTDERAVSYSESILGTIKANDLGVIIGSPTAGANGNVSQVTLPGGYILRYTGMLVRNRDGTQHHLLGVLPDVPLLPTREGIAEGRDEVLEEGLRILGEGVGG